jgi:hypothetical protein
MLVEYDKLSAEIRHVIWGDFLSVETNLDRLLEVVDTQKLSLISFLLQDVEPLPFDYSYFTSYDEDLEYMQPYDLSVMDEEVANLIRSRVPRETKVGGVLKFKNYLAAIRSTMGFDFVVNPFIRMMKFYHDTFNGKDPFVESFDLRITEVSFDSMAAVRYHCLLEAASLSHQKKYNSRFVPGSDMKVIEPYIELVVFLFQNPWVNTIKVKKYTGLFKTMTFSLTKSGQCIKWERPHSDFPVLKDFSLGEIPGNDSAAYQVSIEGLAADKRELEGLGLRKLLFWYISMLSADVNADTVAMSSELSFIETICGFFRGNELASHKKQVAKVPPKPSGKALYAEVLEDRWAQAVQEIEPPNYASYLTRMQGFLTTKSSGGYSVRWDVFFESRRYSITSTDKIMNFFNNPDFFLDRRLVEKELTIDSPAPVFSREVVARDVRAVFAMPLGHYLAELAIGPDLLAWQSQQPQFSLSKEVGRTIADHALGIWASADSRTIIWLMDFDQFDSSQGWTNMRRYALRGIKRGLMLRNRMERFGPWRDTYELYKTIWTRLRTANFITNDVNIVTDSVNSGEYFTIILNNFTNWANLDVLRGELAMREADLFSIMNKVDIKFMGDDSQQIYELTRPVTAAEIDRLQSLAVEVSTGNGLALNKLKTSIRHYYYEYLKKRAEYGWIIPRVFQLQILGSERVNFRLEFQEVLRGFNGLLSEFVGRGGDHRFCTLLSTFVGNLKRRVKIKDKEGVISFENVPPAVLYTPIALKGVGSLPWTLIGASKDALMYMRYNRVQRERINQVAFILDFESGPIKQELAKSALDSATFSKGKRFLKQVQDGERMKQALEAQGRLKSVGIDIGRFVYQNAAARLIRNSIEDNPRIFNVVAEEKQLKAGQVRVRGKMLAGLKQTFRVFEYVVPSELLALNLTLRELRGDVVPVAFHTLVKDRIAQNLEFDDRDIIFESNKIVNRSGKILLIFSTSTHFADSPVITLGQDGNYRVNGFTTDSLSVLREHIYSEINVFSTNFVKDYMEDEFGWLRGIVIDEREDVDFRHPVCPVAGLSSGVANMMRQIGISSEGDQLAVRINKLLLMLAQDPKFPSDLRSETIFEIVSQPSIAFNHERVALVLLSMGASKEHAMLIASEISNISNNFAFVNKTQSYSTADQIIGHMDLSMVNYERLVSVDAIDDLMFSKVLRTLGMLHILTQPTNLLRRKVHISIDGDGLFSIKNKIMGRLFEGVNRFQKVYPHGILE